MIDDTSPGRTPAEPAPAGPLAAWGVTALDYRALTDPVDRAAVRDYRRQSRRRGAAWAAGPAVRGLAVGLSVFIGLVVVAVAVLAINVIADVLAAASMSAADSGATVAFWLLLIVLFVVAAVLSVLAWVRSGPRRKWTNWYRLDRFAQAHGLVAEPLSPGLAYPGAIFRHGTARAGYDRLHSAAGRTLDLGNYRYTVGSDENRITHTWGYLALQLDRRLPHMLLDSRSNTGLFGARTLPISVARNQQLRLEGDFNSHFTLYCPHEYETDALYVFTPDLMALLIDTAGSFDVEIIDEWMFVYSTEPFAMTEPSVLERMFTFAGTVGAKTLSQTERYRDERMPPAASGSSGSTALRANEVAPNGRRLRYGGGWLGAAFFIVLALVGAGVILAQR